MVDTLSQSEIDALLSALTLVDETEMSKGKDKASSSKTASSEDKKKKETLYDFRRQTKFSREQMGTMQMVHEIFARLLGTDLSTRLRAYVQATVMSVEQKTFEEFTQKIYSPTFLTVISDDALADKIMIDMNLSIAFAILDRLLGGSGTPLGILRQLTGVEKRIMQKILKELMKFYEEAWENIVKLSPQIDLIESNPQFAQIVPPNEIVVAIAIEVKIHDIIGDMNICIPYCTVEPIIDRFNAASWFAALRKEPGQGSNLAMLTQLEAMTVPLVVELGTTTCHLSDILNLQPGDYIVTDQSAKNDLNIKVGNLVKFLGTPGISGKRMAISITEVFESHDETGRNI
ncbi:MAG: flagellar motor switch protein FliM [Candidatus Riflebacteria bacterium]|nr:flagellar motor switch protein FliM [Candidatus Riflebacteria bacterium]